MPKSRKAKGGLLALALGAVAGAAALFLSKKENREKTKNVIVKASAEAKRLEKELGKESKRVVAKVRRKSKVLANKAKKSSAKKS